MLNHRGGGLELAMRSAVHAGVDAGPADQVGQRCRGGVIGPEGSRRDELSGGDAVVDLLLHAVLVDGEHTIGEHVAPGELDAVLRVARQVLQVVVDRVHQNALDGAAVAGHLDLAPFVLANRELASQGQHAHTLLRSGVARCDPERAVPVAELGGTVGLGDGREVDLVAVVLLAGHHLRELVVRRQRDALYERDGVFERQWAVQE
ncbi:Uncharacterised protein [Mycobacteroides abscessus subsp. abscessus]|nr:Uncharacterised protein [Mycobacteroides abscessus subsp. abscessus]